MSHNAETAFIKSGLENWKKAVEKLGQHEKSQCHKDALLKKDFGTADPTLSDVQFQTCC
jgi:hypothetical protein